jgi:hypothetical protein
MRHYYLAIIIVPTKKIITTIHKEEYVLFIAPKGKADQLLL